MSQQPGTIEDPRGTISSCLLAYQGRRRAGSTLEHRYQVLAEEGVLRLPTERVLTFDRALLPGRPGTVIRVQLRAEEPGRSTVLGPGRAYEEPVDPALASQWAALDEAAAAYGAAQRRARVNPLLAQLEPVRAAYAAAPWTEKQVILAQAVAYITRGGRA